MSRRLGLGIVSACALLLSLGNLAGCSPMEPAANTAEGKTPALVAAEIAPTKAPQPAPPQPRDSATKATTAAGTTLGRDSQNLYGAFENGFKYIVRKHANPPGRIALFLHVDSGALNESAEQNGLAHFLEHMAFNGSTNFAPGELIPFMSNLGMSFGADSNAHTNHHETVYKLFMPDNKESSLETALKIFSDYATGLLLKEEEIDKERHVVLNEARAHKGVSQRIEDELMPLQYPNTKMAAHDVIGKDEILLHAKRGEFVDYWNTWYRPERMTLIVVADMDPSAVIAKAKATFAGMKARGPARQASTAGIKSINAARAFVLSDPEQVTAEVRVEAILPGRPNMKTVEDYRFNEVENLGNWIMNRRLRELLQRGEAAFQGAFSAVSGVYEDAIVSMTRASGQAEDWNKILDQLIVENHRAIQYGFQERELELAKQDLLSGAKRAVETESTRSASTIVNSISGLIGVRRPLLSAQQNLDILQEVLPKVTLEEVTGVFKQNYDTRGNTYVVILPKRDDFPLPSPEDVLAAASAAWSLKTEPTKEEAAALTILEKLPEPGKVISQEEDKELGVTTLHFENGAIVHHRYMDYKKDQALVSISFPGGSIEETIENRGVSEVAGLINSTSRLSSTQLADVMTGKNVQVGGGVGLDQVMLTISGDPRDFDLGFQFAYAMISEGRIEQSAFDNWKEQALQSVEIAKSHPQAQLQEASTDAIHGSDARLKQLTVEQIEALSVEKGEAWARRLTSCGPVEVSVVGDISLEAAREHVARYIGSLPKAVRSAKELDALRKVARGAGPYAKRVDFKSITPTAFVFAGYMGCEERDVIDRRVLALASRILTERMTKQIREDMQLVYSIGCGSVPGEGLPGTGRIAAGAPTDPEKAELLADTILGMLKEFSTDGPTPEEVETGRLQILTQLETTMKEPGFWLDMLSDMNYRGRTFEEMKQLPDIYKTFTRDQVHEVAKKYMTEERMIRVLAVPKATESAGNDSNEEAGIEKASAPAGK